MPVRVLLDTDIGSDIDDAACLAYLLAQPECALLGITTVTGATDQRAMLASAICKVAGQAVPIYPGLQQPLHGPARQPQVPQAAALDRWPHDEHFPQGQAIDFLRRTIAAHPGEVVLLAIGPLTNVATLFTVHPEAASQLKGLVQMGGCFPEQMPGSEYIEWNIRCDPRAAALVYQTPVRLHRSIGLEVTHRVRLPAGEVRPRFDRPRLRPVLDMAETWFAQRDSLTFHDPLAAVTLFDAHVCRFAAGTVEVVDDDSPLAGLTRWQFAEEGGRHEVAVDVSPERFFDDYFAVFD